NEAGVERCDSRARAGRCVEAKYEAAAFRGARLPGGLRGGRLQGDDDARGLCAALGSGGRADSREMDSRAPVGSSAYARPISGDAGVPLDYSGEASGKSK